MPLKQAKESAYTFLIHAGWLFLLPHLVKYTWERVGMSGVTGLFLTYWDFFWIVFVLRWVFTRYNVKARVEVSE